MSGMPAAGSSQWCSCTASASEGVHSQEENMAIPSSLAQHGSNCGPLEASERQMPPDASDGLHRDLLVA